MSENGFKEPAKATIRRCPDGEGDLCGAKGASEILGVERTRIARWQKLGMLPEPFGRFPSGPVWLRSEIEALAEKRKAEAATAA
jgi:hypothetical protein